MGNHGRRSALGAAGRFALFPARVAARASRGPLEAAADEHLVPELAKLADRAFASDLPEELARSLAEHRVVERVVTELAHDLDVEGLVEQALASPQTKELTDRLLRSDEFHRALRAVVASPEMRAALADQSTGLVDDLASDLRGRAVELDARIETAARRRARFGRTEYAGAATRALGLAVDALAIAAIFALLAGLVAAVSYVVGGLRPAWLVGALLGAGWAIVGGAYLVTFWSGGGRTPGMHLMRVHVRDGRGGPPSVGRASVRALATWVAIVPCFLGYVTVPFDGRRRGLPDFVSGTEIVYDDPGDLV